MFALFFRRLLARSRQPFEQIWNLCLIAGLAERYHEVIQGTLIRGVLFQSFSALLGGQSILAFIEIVLGKEALQSGLLLFFQ